MKNLKILDSNILYLYIFDSSFQLSHIDIIEYNLLIGVLIMIDWSNPSLLKTKTGSWIHYITKKGRHPFRHIGYIEDNNKLHAWDDDGNSVYNVEDYSIIEPIFEGIQNE